MDATERDRLYDQAIALWGWDAQWGMVQEEAAELILAASHLMRGRDSLREVVDAVADMEIMVEQARRLLGNANSAVDTVKESKLERLELRVRRAERAAIAHLPHDGPNPSMASGG